MADFLAPEVAKPGSLDASRRLAAPIHTERHIRVVCVGAGASGLLMAYKLQKHFDNFSLQVFEKNPEVAGTWYENKYPGYVVSSSESPLSLLLLTDTAALVMSLHTTTRGASSQNSTGPRFIPRLRRFSSTSTDSPTSMD